MNPCVADTLAQLAALREALKKTSRVRWMLFALIQRAAISIP